MKSKDFLNEKWSQKYKKSINCSSPKGFSQRAHCAGRKKNESVELDEIDRRGFLKGLGAAALAGAGGAAMAGDLEGQIGPLPIMATIKVQMSDGTVKTKKIDLGHEYDYRLDDAKKEIEQILDRKGVKNYTIHLDRYKDNEAYLDREQMKQQPAAKPADKNDYMDRKPYQPKGGSGSYVDNTPARASGKHNYMDPANYESVQENNDSDEELFSVSQTPPRTAQALYHWSRMDPNRYSFRAIAEFALSNKLTLKQALQVTSRFDEYNEEMQDEYGVDDDQMSDLFGAYEEVCDAWNTDPTGDTSTNDSWEKLREADAELAEPPERPRKTTTKTKTKPDIKFDIPFQQDQDRPLAKTDPLDDLKKKAGLGDEPKVNIKKAKQKDTLSKTAGIGSDDMADMLSRMRNIEIDRDLEAYPEPEPPETLPSVEVNTANLPAVAGQALQAAGVQNPDFHQVANLPGNMADQIRQLGKSLFGSLTMTPTKRIHVVANLGGQGPNSSAEVNAVAGFLKDHGKDLGPGDIDFEAVMPGYKAQTHMFSAAGIRWMLVKDFAGQYIYCWPEEDSHDAVDAIGQDTDIKRLK
jgi:hypothetical protein